jgi:hypothetical protein
MSNAETQIQLIGLAILALGAIFFTWLFLSVINRPRYRRKTNTPENAQEILNKYFGGYTGGNDLSDSMPVNALSSDESLPLKEFLFLSGDSLVVKARNEEEAWKKFEADLEDADCPCGRLQEHEVDYDTDYCDCIESGETLTWVQED